MSFSNKFLSGAAVAALSMSFAGMAQADACDTPSKLGDLGNFAGEVITIAGSMEGKDEEMLLNTVSCFEKATGAVVQYSGSRDFAALVVADLRSNNAPNIAIFPQPGLAADMAKEGHLVPLGDDLASWMSDNYGAGSSWVDLGTYADANGKEDFYGFAFKMDLKSLVWYSPEQFEDNGYEIPIHNGRADCSVRSNGGRWQYALVYWCGIGQCDGLDCDRLDGRSDAAHNLARKL